MDRESIIEYTNGSKLMIGETPLSVVTQLNGIVDVKLEFDKCSLDYYYSVSIDELAERDISEDTLKILMDNGFSQNEDKTKLVRYITD